MHASNNNTKPNDIHIIFSHGLGDNYKYASEICKALEARCEDKGMPNIHAHAHKYPAAFQNYQTYVTISFLFFGASILAPIIMIACSQSIIMIGLASLAALTCISLSMLLIAVPLMYKDQNLFKSSIEKIEQLIQGVDPTKIILLGHSFGGVTISEVLKYFAKKNVTLGGVVFANAFSSFEKVIQYLPMFQLKVLNLLPSFLSKKLLKALGLDFDIVRDLLELHNEEKLNTPIVIINNESDKVIPLLAQLKRAVQEDKTLSSQNEETIKILNAGKGSHEAVLYGHELQTALTELISKQALNATISSL